MKTIKLYDKNSYLRDFEAKVVSVVRREEKYYTELVATAFFPESAGQTGDTGFIGAAAVLNTVIEDGVIYHICDMPLEIGKSYPASLDFEERFDKMQNHSGEHIVSGIIHKLYGYDNIGFHLSKNCVTLDINGELSRADLKRIELEANKAVQKNAEIRAYYPDKKVLKSLNYRSKLDLQENVRIVDIEGYDICACCAPHVKRTGEIGSIKLLRSQKNRGGLRIYINCGMRAVCDYYEKNRAVSEISSLLCSKQEDVVSGVKALLKSYEHLQFEITGLRRQYLLCKIEGLENAPYFCFFEQEIRQEDMRFAANKAKEKCKIAAVFCKKDSGYSYICCSESIDMCEFAKTFNSALDGKGGGRGEMIQGSVNADSAAIDNFFKNYVDKF